MIRTDRSGALCDRRHIEEKKAQLGPGHAAGLIVKGFVDIGAVEALLQILGDLKIGLVDAITDRVECRADAVPEMLFFFALVRSQSELRLFDRQRPVGPLVFQQLGPHLAQIL